MKAVYEAIATKEEYIDALIKLRDKSRFVKDSNKYLAMLRVHALSKNQTVTSSQLADAVGFENYNAANLRYGLLAHEIADIINYTPDQREKDKSYKWFMALSIGIDASKDTIDEQFEFVMRPELYEALITMRWVRLD